MKKKILPSILFLMISVDAFSSSPPVAEITIVNKTSEYDLISCNYNNVPVYLQDYDDFAVSVNSAADAWWDGGAPTGGYLYSNDWLKDDGTESDAYGDDQWQNYLQGAFYNNYYLREQLVSTDQTEAGTKITSNAAIQPGGSFSTHFRNRGDAGRGADGVVSCTLVPEGGNGSSVFRIIQENGNFVRWEIDDSNIRITKDQAHSSVDPNPGSHAVIDTFDINYG